MISSLEECIISARQGKLDDIPVFAKECIEVALAAISFDADNLKHFSYFNDCEEVVEYAISKNPNSLMYASLRLQEKYARSA